MLIQSKTHYSTIIYARDLPDMYVQSLRAYIHIRQIMSAHVTSNMYQFWYSYNRPSLQLAALPI